MKEFEAQEGVAFLLIYFKNITYTIILHMNYYQSFGKEPRGWKKSFRFDELDLSFQIHIKNSVCIHYLEQLQRFTFKGSKYQDNIKA